MRGNDIMKIVKGIANILGILAALILSLPLTVMLLATPFVSAGSSFLQTESLQRVVDQLDFSELLRDSLEGETLEGELLDELMETKFMEEVLALYVEDFFLALDGEGGQKHLTPDTFSQLLREHIDVLLPIMKGYIGINIPLPEKELASLVLSMLEAEAEDIIGMLPTMEDLGLDESVILAVKYLRQGTVLKAFIGAAVVLSIFIALCRCVGFKGFLWLGVVYFFSALIVCITALLARNFGAVLLNESVPEAEVVLESVLEVFTTEVLKGAGVLAGLAIGFILVFVLGRKIHKKENSVVKAA